MAPDTSDERKKLYTLGPNIAHSLLTNHFFKYFTVNNMEIMKRMIEIFYILTPQIATCMKY